MARVTLLVLMIVLAAPAEGQRRRREAAPPPAPQVLADSIKAAVTPELLTQHARAIIEHERPSGSPGELAAIDYIVGTLAADGVPVEVHEFLAYTSDPVAARVEVLGERLAPEAITVAFSRAVRNLEAPLVDVGDPTALAAFALGSGERLELAPSPGAPSLAGTIALVDAQPRPDIAWKLERLGAVGAIFVNPEERLNELIVTTVWGTPSLRNRHRIPSLAAAQVKRSGGEAIRRLLALGPVRVRLTTELRQGWQPLRLAVATVPAADSGAPFVVFGGHIDAWYYGATDEGASNAAMLALAQAFHRHRARLRRSLVVAWWPGHSNGRYAGATWFADHRHERLRTDALAYVNVDGIGQMRARQFSATATAALAGLAARVVQAGVGEAVTPTPPGRNSDMAFHGVGLPVLQLHHTRLAEEGGYWWWHTPDDTFDKVDFDILKTDTDLYADALAELLAAPLFPVDLAAEVDALGRLLAERTAVADGRFDLSAAVARQQRLAALVRDVQRAVAGARDPDAALDRAVVRVLRPLQRVTYTLLGPYHPDPAVEVGLLPGLAPLGTLSAADPASDRYGFALATLVRERNRLVDALDEAIAAAAALVP